MNAISEFESKIASQRFGSFKELQDNLSLFSNVSFLYCSFTYNLQTFGYRFVNAKFSYYDEGTKNRDRFVYKYLDLKCAYAKKRDCTACCNVRCRRNFMYIRHWSMEHNHPPDPPDTSTLVDCTESFKRTFVSMLFDSFTEFEAKIRELERVTGTKFTKYSSRMLPDSSEHRERLVYERVNYGCIHSGKTKHTNSVHVGVRSQKIGCQARIRACIAKDKLKVMLYSMKHNHIVSNGYRPSGPSRLSIHLSDGPSVPTDDYETADDDAEVDFELDLPNLAATAANGFRDVDLPAMPIVLKKTKSSDLQPSSKEARRARRQIRSESVKYTRGQFSEADSFSLHEPPINYQRSCDKGRSMTSFYGGEIDLQDGSNNFYSYDRSVQGTEELNETIDESNNNFQVNIQYSGAQRSHKRKRYSVYTAVQCSEPSTFSLTARQNYGSPTEDGCYPR
uniref:FAR1 domain-containing protein n=1 Tax=Mesocestoides corti TaxID=53468 RepID=A0A5K3EGW2_MESCO